MCLPKYDIITFVIRCIYLLSASKHYGCIDAHNRWSTPSFESLGFLDMMSLSDGLFFALKGIIIIIGVWLVIAGQSSSLHACISGYFCGNHMVLLCEQVFLF